MKITYSKFNPSKALNYVNWFNDINVTFGLSPYTPHDFPSILKWSILVWLNKNKRYFFIKNGNKVIGHVGLTLNKDVKTEGEISLVIGETKYWNRGIGRMAVLEMIDLAKEIKLKKIVARIYNKNLISMNLFNSLGFRSIGAKTTWEDKCFLHYIYKV
jgi:RimJ/RimL family protein N-acetyltransferase